MAPTRGTEAARLELRHVTKTYPGVVANDDVSMTVGHGRVHGLMGENGAGKSTLMSILYGAVQPDSGEILVDGVPRRFSSPTDGIGAGLGMVFQSFKLYPSLSVAENVVMGAEPGSRWRVRRGTAERRVAALAEEYDLSIDPRARVGDLAVGVQQRVEILRALHREARTLILDEPTAVLTVQETDRFLEGMRRLADGGMTIVLVTHKIREVLAVADEITVMRRGRAVVTLPRAEADAEVIVEHMTGRSVDLSMPAAAAPPGEVVLRCEGVTVASPDPTHPRPVVDDVRFTVRAGEIVGIAGVAGNGQEQLIATIAGLHPITRGSVHLGSTDITHASVEARRDAGLAYVPEDRHGVGTAGGASIEDNLLAGFHRRPPFARRGLLQRAAAIKHADRLMAEFDIRAASRRSAVGTLSGGNMQKVVVARELAHHTPVLVAEQPTRGVDVGAMEMIHRQLAEFRDGGRAVLLVSAELSELLSLSTRILVILEGRVVGEVDARTTNEKELGLMMTGVARAPGVPA